MSGLDPEELEALEVALHALAAELAAGLAGGDDRSATVELDQAAVGRVSRVDALQAQQMAAAERRRAEVRQVHVARALAAVEDGTYGACARCGDEIAGARLRARPETPFCVRCASALGA